MLNRNQAPAFRTIDKIEVIRATENKLKNGIPLFTVSAGSQEICKIEFLFRAGMYHQPAPLVASCANALLECGTRSYTAHALSEGLDFYGSYLELQVEQDFASVTLFCLNKYLNESLVFIEEMLKYPSFPEDEFRIHLSNKKQRHIINSEKVSVLARRKFAELLYGEKHPYGIVVKEKHFDELKSQALKDFFAKHYSSANCSIIASGLLPESLTETLNRFFGEQAWGSSAFSDKGAVPLATTNSRKHFVAKEAAIQSAIRVGRPLFNKTHPDYFHFQVLNTILGGYFGSRLMANIREDKGYTYGIGSGLSNLLYGGSFFISTEVGADVTRQALKEIYAEIARLREEKVEDQELETVRNYILGQFLRSVDGPFALADKFKAIWEYGLDYRFYDNYFDAVKKVNAGQIRDLANRYLQEKDLIECVVGKM